MTTRTAPHKTTTAATRRNKRKQNAAEGHNPDTDTASAELSNLAAETSATTDANENLATEAPAESTDKAVRLTKRARLIALLERPGGVTLGGMAGALGWLPHTTRAALTGLRKQGHMIERQLNAEGASVYSLTKEA